MSMNRCSSVLAGFVAFIKINELIMNFFIF